MEKPAVIGRGGWWRQPARREAALFVLLMLAPAVALYGFFVLSPMAQAFWIALHDWRGVSDRITFIGPANFQGLAADPVFRVCLTHNFALFLITGGTILTLALYFSNALASGIRGAGFYRVLFLFPNVVSIIAVGVLWRFIYNPSFGILSGGLRAIHLEAYARPWLGDPQTALPAIAVTYVWYALGFYVLLFIAGIHGIPAEVNEAAVIDGASGWQRFRFVTLPLLREVVRMAVIYLLINSLNTFGLVWVMTEGGADRSSEVVLTYLYEQAFENSRFGYATAIGAFNFVVVLLVTLGLQRLWRADPTR